MEPEDWDAAALFVAVFASPSSLRASRSGNATRWTQSPHRMPLQAWDVMMDVRFRNPEGRDG